MIAGLDEAGCGTLVGPLIAAAVCLPAEFDTSDIKDSKKLSKKKREILYERIRTHAYVGVGIVTLDEINTIKFSYARKLVFQRAMQDLVLHITPNKIIVDGSGFFDGFENIPYECIIKADAKYLCVSAASIVAKTLRDHCIYELCEEDSANAARYQWQNNKGYPTKDHLSAIQKWGITVHHRIQFKPCHSRQC